MGRIWMPGGGGGADLDVVTAKAGDVLSGKVIVDKDGNPITGTLINNGAVSAALNCGASYAIPAGYHNGNGKITANSLASQTSGTATAGVIAKDKTLWVNGVKITGTLASKAAATITPGTANQTIAAGQILIGAQTILGDADLISANILRGKNIFNVAGASNVVKYISGTATSGTSTVYFDASEDRTAYYFTLSPGFTPVFGICVSNLQGSSANMTIIDGTAIYLCKYNKNYNGDRNTNNVPFSSSSVRFPVYAKSASYNYWIFGY